VKDMGIGIPEKIGKTIGDLFKLIYQIKWHQGTGLGLSI
jgi:signal transduction histidine kinase